MTEIPFPLRRSPRFRSRLAERLSTRSVIRGSRRIWPSVADRLRFARRCAQPAADTGELPVCSPLFCNLEPIVPAAIWCAVTVDAQFCDTAEALDVVGPVEVKGRIAGGLAYPVAINAGCTKHVQTPVVAVDPACPAQCMMGIAGLWQGDRAALSVMLTDGKLAPLGQLAQ